MTVPATAAVMTNAPTTTPAMHPAEQPPLVCVDSLGPLPSTVVVKSTFCEVVSDSKAFVGTVVTVVGDAVVVSVKQKFGETIL